jgi:hypothetical protein
MCINDAGFRSLDEEQLWAFVFLLGGQMNLFVTAGSTALRRKIL